MANCCHCAGIEEEFDLKTARRDRARYRRKGPDRTTRLLIEQLLNADISGMRLIDIGGGIGVIQHELLAAGIEHVVAVEASGGYQSVVREEAVKRGTQDRITFLHGDFVEIGPNLNASDIVTLDRVICCYPDMPRLVDTSAPLAGQFYGLVFPRDNWWVRLGVKCANLFFRIKRSDFRTFVHQVDDVDHRIRSHGLQRTHHRQTFLWHVSVYEKR